jgi:hypothetical protein
MLDFVFFSSVQERSARVCYRSFDLRISYYDEMPRLTIAG